MMIKRLHAAALTTTTVVALSACTASGGQNGSGPAFEGVPAGSSKDVYIAALTDMDPVTLSMQLPAPPDVLMSAAPEHYAEAVEEWSGGKITFEILYSGSRVPITQMHSALNEGLIDSGLVLPATAAQEFPVTTYAADMMFLHEPTPVAGTMTFFASWIELASATDVIVEEFIDQGIRPLIPMLPTDSGTVLCNDAPLTSLAQASGQQIRLSSPSNVEFIEQLGATSVSIETSETYDALQRGVVDCAIWSVTGVPFSGLLDTVAHWTLSSEVQFPGTPMSFAISEEVWNDLPLTAQQLLWDRLDVYLESHLTDTVFGQFSEAIGMAREQNVQIHEWQSDASDSLKNLQNDIIANISDDAPAGINGEEFLASASQATEKWNAFIVEELGYEHDVPWDDIDIWLEDNPIDVDDLVEILIAEIIQPNRP